MRTYDEILAIVKHEGKLFSRLLRAAQRLEATKIVCVTRSFDRWVSRVLWKAADYH